MTNNSSKQTQEYEGVGRLESAIGESAITSIKVAFAGLIVGATMGVIESKINPRMGNFIEKNAPTMVGAAVGLIGGGTIGSGIGAIVGFNKGGAAIDSQAELVDANNKLAQENKTLTNYIVGAINHQGFASNREHNVQFSPA